MKLLSLDNYCFSEWWAEKARNETMIVHPHKIVTSPDAPSYEGYKINAFTFKEIESFFFV